MALRFPLQPPVKLTLSMVWPSSVSSIWMFREQTPLGLKS